MNRINEVIFKIKPIDIQFEEMAQNHLDDLTKPRGSLGKLEVLAKQVVCITESMNPSFKHKVIFTMAGDHGVTDEGVSAFPKEVTLQMIHNFLNGGAAINVLARHIGGCVDVVDMGVCGDVGRSDKNFIVKKIANGTANFAKGPAMTRDQAIASIVGGIDVFYERKLLGIDILGVGDMGIGNTTASSAVIACISGKSPGLVVGRGTGIGDDALMNKINVIKNAIALNKPDKSDPIDVLAKVGGFEIGGIAGAILAAAANRVPVVVDGFIATAGALIALELAPDVRPYLIASHRSKELGHSAVLDFIGLNPVLDLDMRLGEGTGAALTISIVEASIKIFTQMATFSGASVSTEVEFEKKSKL